MKLLHKTLKVYITFSIIVLLVSAPLFYLLTDKLFIEDADEALLLHQKEFLQYNLPSLKTNEIETWNKFSRDIKINDEDKNLSANTISFRFFYDSLADENEPYRVLLSPIEIEGKNYILMARINLIESEDLILNLATLFCLTLLLLLVGFYIITRRLSLKLWLPFYSTLDTIETFELEKDHKPVFTKTNVEEFNRLNASIDRLLENNIGSFNSQKDFIENASHELQTPLATLQAKLDMLVQQIPMNEELSKSLSSFNDTISGLSRINKNLLLLSKIDNKQFQYNSRVPIDAIIKKQLEFFSEQAEEKQISIVTGIIESVAIEANEALVEIATSNLLLNAVRHNFSQGSISITLQHGTLTVANTSDGTPLMKQKLFQRFSTQNSNGGSGLGLAIVDRICKFYNWRIDYSFENNMHIFSIKF